MLKNNLVVGKKVIIMKEYLRLVIGEIYFRVAAIEGEEIYKTLAYISTCKTEFQWLCFFASGGMMSVFLMGCYDEAKDVWCTVTKVHTGHDDATLQSLQVIVNFTALFGIFPK